MKITDILQRIIDDQQETIKNHEETIRGLQGGIQQLINAHQQTVEELRLTKDQFQSFKQNGSKENWWTKYSGEIIVGVVTGIFGIIGTLLGIFL